MTMLSERQFTAAARDKAAGQGAAMKDGSFPILNGTDLKNAIAALGRAKDPAAARRHIIARAKALGLVSSLPKDWAVQEAALMAEATSFDQRREALQSALRPKKAPSPVVASAEETYSYIRELFDDYAIVSKGGELFKLPYTMSDAGVVKWGEATKVAERKTYVAAEAHVPIGARIALDEMNKNHGVGGKFASGPGGGISSRGKVEHGTALKAPAKKYVNMNDREKEHHRQAVRGAIEKVKVGSRIKIKTMNGGTHEGRVISKKPGSSIPNIRIEQIRKGASTGKGLTFDHSEIAGLSVLHESATPSATGTTLEEGMKPKRLSEAEATPTTGTPAGTPAREVVKNPDPKAKAKKDGGEQPDATQAAADHDDSALDPAEPATPAPDAGVTQDDVPWMAEDGEPVEGEEPARDPENLPLGEDDDDPDTTAELEGEMQADEMEAIEQKHYGQTGAPAKGTAAEAEGSAAAKFTLPPAYRLGAAKEAVNAELRDIEARARAAKLTPTRQAIIATFRRNFERLQKLAIAARATERFGKPASESVIERAFARRLGQFRLSERDKKRLRAEAAKAGNTLRPATAPPAAPQPPQLNPLAQLMAQSASDLPKDGDELAESFGDDTGIIQLEEKAVRRDGTIRIKIAKPGWGSKGYYGKDLLEKQGPKTWPSGTHMYWNHPTAQEAQDRPERDLRDLAAVTVTPPTYMEQGPKGPGLYTDAKVFSDYQRPVEELAEHIGTSLRAQGTFKWGEAEGQEGPIIESFLQGHSIDFVTKAGLGGEVLNLFESARGGNFRSGVYDAGNRPGAAGPQEDDVSQQELEEANRRIARLEEAQAIGAARVLATSILARATLPDVTKVRLAESLSANPPIAKAENGDRSLDREAFTTLVEAAAKAEAAYLQEAAGLTGNVRGVGLSEADGNPFGAPIELDEAALDAELTARFQSLGMSEAGAKIAVAGRN